jgi:hypothetical protein
MVSDPGETLGEVPEAKSGDRAAYGRQLAVTLVLLALYWHGPSVGLPFVDRAALPGFDRNVLSILALDLTPLLTGFLLVELFSLLARPGKRLRRGGLAGRATLNRAALATSLVVAAAQALGIALFLESMRTPDGAPAVSAPGWAFRITLIATLTAVTAALFALGNFLSVRGIGNGFCLLLLADLARSVFQEWEGWSPVPGQVTPLAVLTSPLVLLALLLLAYFTAAERRQPALPVFPQGVAPVVWAVGLLVLPGSFQRFFTPSAPPFQPGSWASIGALLVLIPVLSWGAFHMFSGPSRLKSELRGDPKALAGLALALRRRLLPSTAALTAGAVALFAWGAFQPTPPVSWISFAALGGAVAIGLDLRDQLRFTARHGGAERLLELDNVHLANRLAERLQSRGLDVHFQALRYRSLFFFFGPLVKIGLLVPGEQAEQAWQEIEEVPVEVV